MFFSVGDDWFALQIINFGAHHSPDGGELRITEDGQDRITEDGQLRETE
jgi:hypothetical protein